MAGAKIALSSTAGELKTDGNDNARVNLPVAGAQAGYAQLNYVPGGSLSKVGRVTTDGHQHAGIVRKLFDLDFNSASTSWSAQIGTVATTLTKAVVNGAMRLNSGGVTTTTTGIAIYSNPVFAIEHGYEYRVTTTVKTVNATATNKQWDLGLGYYAFAAGQAAAMNEFIGFRWTTTGGLLGVVETSQGGAPTSQTVNINGNVPYADNIFKQYEVVFTDEAVEFWVDGVYQAQLAKPSGSWGVLKGTSLPWIARQFHSGAASAAPTFDLGEVAVIKIGPDDGVPQPTRAALMGRASYYWQPDLTTGTTDPHLFPASGTAPTANAGSNTASAANNTAVLGGLIRNTLTGVTVTLSTNVLWTAWQNPALPTAAGVANNGRNFIVTGLSIGPMVVTTALVGGGFTAAWFAAIGATATSLATTNADGTTAVAQKAPRFVPLSLVSTLAATAALATVSTDVGDHQFTFPTPLVVHPGEFFAVGFRTIAVAAAVTAGSADAMIHVNGYWES